MEYIQKRVTEPIMWEGERDDIDITQIISLSGLTHQGQEYQGSHPVHGSTTGGNFCINPSKGTWHCFRCDSGGGALSLIAILEGIIDCPEAVPGGIRGDTFKKVIQIATEKYGIELNQEGRHRGFCKPDCLSNHIRLCGSIDFSCLLTVDKCCGYKRNR